MCFIGLWNNFSCKHFYILLCYRCGMKIKYKLTIDYINKSLSVSRVGHHLNKLPLIQEWTGFKQNILLYAHVVLHVSHKFHSHLSFLYTSTHKKRIIKSMCVVILGLFQKIRKQGWGERGNCFHYPPTTTIFFFIIWLWTMRTVLSLPHHL